MIVKCDCKHEQQDKIHGQGKRVANPVNKSKVQGVLKQVRCTVCKRLHSEWSN